MKPSTILKVRTPAKLILSGEHSVVYGYPALAMAIDRYTETTARYASPLEIAIHLTTLNFKHQFSLNMLHDIKRRLKRKYQKFLAGEYTIRQVLQKPFELTVFTIINLIDTFKTHLHLGLDITTESNIPVGCGLGSSASIVVSVLHVLNQFFNLNLSVQEYIKLGIESENLQHGYSSGLDVQIAYHGGCLRYQQGQQETRPLPEFPFYLIQTGTPDSSTGECVKQASMHFKHPALGDDFAAITHELDKAIQHNDLTMLRACIRENHRLLKAIGVVPDKIHQFIQDLEKLGAAGKICGAGSIRGDQGGILLVSTDTNIDPLLARYGYSSLHVRGEPRGTTVIQS